MTDALREELEQLIEFLQHRAEECRKARQYVAAVGHNETIKHLKNIIKEHASE